MSIKGLAKCFGVFLLILVVADLVLRCFGLVKTRFRIEIYSQVLIWSIVLATIANEFSEIRRELKEVQEQLKQERAQQEK